MSRDPRSPGRAMSGPHSARSEQEYMESEMVMKTASAKSRRKAMVSSSRLTVQSARDLEGVVALGGRSDARRHRRW